MPFCILFSPSCGRRRAPKFPKVSLDDPEILKVCIALFSKWKEKNVRSVPTAAAEQTRGGKGKKTLGHFFSLVTITGTVALSSLSCPQFQLRGFLGSSNVNPVNVKFTGRGLSKFPFKG